MPYADKDKKHRNSRAWALAHPKQRKKASQAWYARNKERVKKTSAAWKKKNKQRIAQRHIEKTYGLSPEAFEALWAAQGGRCPICLRSMSRMGMGSTSVCTDHDHATERVRGLLCRRCNLFLGMGGDTVQMFIRAVDYLQRTAS